MFMSSKDDDDGNLVRDPADGAEYRRQKHTVIRPELRFMHELPSLL
jgi:hypothetical protein